MLANQQLDWRYYGTDIKDSKLYYYDIKSYSSKIGRVERIKVFDKNSLEIAETEFSYGNELPGNQGTFTSGSILCEFQQGPENTSSSHFKASRTLKTAYPNVLTSVRTTSNGVATVRNNTAWDFLTGTVLREDATNSQGERYQMVTVPAYSKYPELRSKAQSIANKNMLTQLTASYAYKLNSSGQLVDLLDASVQTWNKDWDTYRQYNANSGRYESETNSTPVWRRHKSYIWANKKLNNKGLTSIQEFSDFLWPNGSLNRNWQLVDEVTAYNHFSTPIESKSLSGNYATSKLGYNNSLTIADAQNARMGELAYSGAEDVLTVGNVQHFGGEVRGAEYRSNEKSHTGRYSTKLAPGQKGFVFESRVGAADGVESGRSYKASVWWHHSDIAGASGRIFAKLINEASTNELATIAVTDPSTKRAGEWCLLDLYFDVPASSTGQLLQVGCENASSSNSVIYFDDFRFHPVDAPVTSYVYDSRTWQLTHVLNQDNLYTAYEYDAAGKLIRVYKEVLTKAGSAANAERKLIKESQYNYARNATFTVEATAVGTGQLTSSLDGGLVNSVENGGEVRYTAVSTDCRSKFSLDQTDAIRVDGVAITRDRILSDGTRVDRLQNGCILSNVRGPHTVELKFTNYTVAELNTRI